MKKESMKDKLSAVIADITAACASEGKTVWDSGLLNSHNRPVNYVTRKEYQGFNALWFSYVAHKRGLKVAEFATFKQIAAAGGHVRKGEKGTHGFFWGMFNPDKKSSKETEEDLKEELRRKVPFVKGFTVFAIETQTDLETKRKLVYKENPPMEALEKFVQDFCKETNCGFEETHGTAFYSPSRHAVAVSPLNEYASSDAYYSTVLHELVHSTAKVMKRNTGLGSFVKSDEKYSKEEIVAECGAMLLCSYFGISKVERDNSAQYIKGWSETLRNNPTWLMSGMNAAERAVKYMLEVTGLEVPEDDEEAEEAV